MTDVELGDLIINTIIEGRLVRPDEGNLLVWSGNAKEQIGAAIRDVEREALDDVWNRLVKTANEAYNLEGTWGLIRKRDLAELLSSIAPSPVLSSDEEGAIKYALQRIEEYIWIKDGKPKLGVGTVGVIHALIDGAIAGHPVLTAARRVRDQFKDYGEAFKRFTDDENLLDLFEMLDAMTAALEEVANA